MPSKLSKHGVREIMRGQGPTLGVQPFHTSRPRYARGEGGAAGQGAVWGWQ